MEQHLGIEHRLTAVEDRSRSNAHRLTKLEQSTEAINRMAISIEKMAMKQDAMNAKVDHLSTDVETLKAGPGKRWNGVVEKVIFTVVAATIGFVLAKIGL